MTNSGIEQPQQPGQQQDQNKNEETNTPLSPSAQLDLAITLALYSWPALSLAVESSWGGPASSSKRDWFCGAIADMFSSRPETDAQDLEDVLIQVMNDEFDVVVDDESAGDIADLICTLRGDVEKGEFARVKAMWEEWKVKEQQSGGDPKSLFKKVEARDEDQETDEDDEDEDVEMGDAPAASIPKPKEAPEVDDDGFTKVVGRRNR